MNAKLPLRQLTLEIIETDCDLSLATLREDGYPQARRASRRQAIPLRRKSAILRQPSTLSRPPSNPLTPAIRPFSSKSAADDPIIELPTNGRTGAVLTQSITTLANLKSYATLTKLAILQEFAARHLPSSSARTGDLY